MIVFKIELRGNLKRGDEMSYMEYK